MALTAQLTHFGHTVDLGRMVDFRVMGFVISDQGVARSGASIVFMTQDPAQRRDPETHRSDAPAASTIHVARSMDGRSAKPVRRTSVGRLHNCCRE